MMFSRAISLSALALPLLATASALPGGGPPPTCAAGTGTLQCCDQTLNADAQLVTVLLGLLGITNPFPNLLVGITCAVFGGSCADQSACCVDNSFNGIVALGCTNINI